MQKLAFFLALAALAGCGGGRSATGPLGEAMGDGNWFCESTADGESWDCIQDPELASAPQSQRTTPAVPAFVTGTAAENPTTDDLGEIADGESIGVDFAAPGSADASPPEIAPEMTVAVSEPESDIEPEAAPNQTDLLDLPADHYAVQLLAMASAAELQEFITENQLQHTLTARVERNGELYYVLLLGVYGNLELARQASLELPTPLSTTEPWIRPMASLQNAVIRGNALAVDLD